MTNEQFKKLKQDPTVKLSFGSLWKSLDNLKSISFNFVHETKWNGVIDFEITIEVIKEFRQDDKIELIYVVRNHPQFDFAYRSHWSFENLPLFFKDYESAKKFVFKRAKYTKLNPKN